MPKIIDAFRLVPEGIAPGLQPTNLAAHMPIDPSKQDFLRAAIEERRRVEDRTHWPKTRRDRISKGIKVFANAASYGIYAEMHRQESDEEMDVLCHGLADARIGNIVT